MEYIFLVPIHIAAFTVCKYMLSVATRSHPEVRFALIRSAVRNGVLFAVVVFSVRWKSGVPESPILSSLRLELVFVQIAFIIACLMTLVIAASRTLSKQP